MVKRKSFRHLGYVAFALIILLACWESNKASAAVISPVIPQESIRLRILANSDTLEDQDIKHRVRDAVVAQMNQWVTGPQTIEQARATVNEHLPEIRQLVGGMLEQYGYDYGYTAELGVVPFPTKMYGDRVYPAGDYEALRITLGSGQGQNWWCVLFPPLCFVDAATGEAVASDKQPDPAAGSRSGTAVQTSAKDGGQAGMKQASKTNSGKSAALGAADPAPKAHLQIDSKKEVHFFLWDMLKKLVSWLNGLFR